MIKIAILSDSHRKTDLTIEAIEHLKKQGAQYLIHAGDLEIRENLEALKNSKLPYVSVFGNNDLNLIQYSNEYNINQEPYYFKIKQFSFKLMHMPFYLTSDTDIVIYGHTHQFKCEMGNQTLMVNPGEVCARNKNLSECVLLKIDDNKFIVEYFFRLPNESNWSKEQFQYERA